MAADDLEYRILTWLNADADRRAALVLASQLRLRDWCLAAGFVRNLVWDHLHGYSRPTPLNDIDLIYFDPGCVSERRDRDLEARLRAESTYPWSVKNQARMHRRNGDAPYLSTEDAMRHWVEVETAVGVKLDPDSGSMVLVAPFGLASLMAGSLSYNPACRNPAAFRERLKSKAWLSRWPGLVTMG